MLLLGGEMLWIVYLSVSFSELFILDLMFDLSLNLILGLDLIWF